MSIRPERRDLLWIIATLLTLSPILIYVGFSYRQLKSRDHYVLASGRTGGLYFDLGELLPKTLMEVFIKRIL